MSFDCRGNLILAKLAGQLPTRSPQPERICQLLRRTGPDA